VKRDYRDAPVSSKLKALLAIAGSVQQGGKAVTPADIAAAKAAGATDVEIHDAILIAAAFCMFNRYVDGLAMLTPVDPRLYDAMGQRMAQEGYVPARAGVAATLSAASPGDARCARACRDFARPGYPKPRRRRS
jgi:hypothetical protein